MLQSFDGTEELTYTPLWKQGLDSFKAEEIQTDAGPAVRFTGNPPYDVVDCLAEVRNVTADVLRAKEAASLCDDTPYLDDTQLGCAGELAEWLGSCDPYAEEA